MNIVNAKEQHESQFGDQSHAAQYDFAFANSPINEKDRQ
jgi:hypothetical protein